MSITYTYTLLYIYTIIYIDFFAADDKGREKMENVGVSKNPGGATEDPIIFTKLRVLDLLGNDWRYRIAIRGIDSN